MVLTIPEHGHPQTGWTDWPSVVPMATTRSTESLRLGIAQITGTARNLRIGWWTGFGVSFQVHLLILHGAPQPLHEDVVEAASLSVHADLHPVFLQRLDELPAGELATPVGVKHLGLALPQRLLQGIDAEVGLQGVGTIAGPPRTGCASP